MSEALSVDDFAAQLSQADQPEQPQNEDSGPDETVEQESEGQPEGQEADTEAQAEEEGEEGQEEQPDEPDSPEDRVIKWQTANGEAFEVTEKELQAGYMRDSDYRQKTQTVAEERKQVQQLAQQKFQEVEQLQVEYGQLYSVQTELKQCGQVNWQQLQAEDPATYQQAVTRLLLLQNQESQILGQVNGRRQQLAQQSQVQQQTNWQEANDKAVQELAAHIKGFDADAGIREKAIKQMSTTGQTYGFTAEELGQVADGRMLKVLYDAAQWRALQAQKPQAVKKVAAAPQKAPAAQRTAPSKSEQIVKTAVNAKGMTPKQFAAALAQASKR